MGVLVCYSCRGDCDTKADEISHYSALNNPGYITSSDFKHDRDEPPHKLYRKKLGPVVFFKVVGRCHETDKPEHNEAKLSFRVAWIWFNTR